MAFPVSPVLRRLPHPSKSGHAAGNRCPRRCGSGARPGWGSAARPESARAPPPSPPRRPVVRSDPDPGRPGERDSCLCALPRSREAAAAQHAEPRASLAYWAARPRSPRERSSCGPNPGTAESELTSQPGPRAGGGNGPGTRGLQRRRRSGFLLGSGHVAAGETPADTWGGAGPALALPLTHNAPPRRARTRPFGEPLEVQRASTDCRSRCCVRKNEPREKAAKAKGTAPGSGGIRTHAPEETGALIQRLRPLGHATDGVWCFILCTSTLRPPWRDCSY